MPRALSRRTLLKTSAVAATTFTAPNYLRARNANEKLNLAITGAGGRGAANLSGVASENIVALCDVSTPAVEKAAEAHKGASTFTDFRKVFDRAKEFDAVVVSTCEHTHAFATILAIRHGKHVYCEKPLTHNCAAGGNLIFVGYSPRSRLWSHLRLAVGPSGVRSICRFGSR